MVSTRVTDPWLTWPRPNPRAALRLFCLPYAGGSALIYRNWPEGLPSAVEVCAIQIPGRGSRMHERPFRKLLPLVGVLKQSILPHLDRPFAFFGHSMGAAIAFELSRLLKKEHGLEPLHLYVSGRRSPSLPNDVPMTYNSPDPEFFKHLRQLNGTPREVLAHPDLMALMMPVLRADFELIQTYTYEEGPPLDCPITVFGGLQDEDTSKEQLQAWRGLTAGAFDLMMLEGDHFFIQTHEQLFLRLLSKELFGLLHRLN
jgi:medium-chain acyl-[acyl-carrier-protein] hydrolase